MSPAEISNVDIALYALLKLGGDTELVGRNIRNILNLTQHDSRYSMLRRPFPGNSRVRFSGRLPESANPIGS